MMVTQYDRLFNATTASASPFVCFKVKASLPITHFNTAGSQEESGTDGQRVVQRSYLHDERKISGTGVPNSPTVGLL